MIVREDDIPRRILLVLSCMKLRERLGGDREMLQRAIDTYEVVLNCGEGELSCV